ncbi:MAG: S8 family serine peptidase [Acidobacteria bacterium]|nr:S8 family serine peptidase [Acidobacteriota bacterium]
MFKKHLSLFLALASCALLVLPRSQAVASKRQTGGNPAYVRNQILVKLKAKFQPERDNVGLPNEPQNQLARELVPRGGRRAEALADDLQQPLYVIELDDYTSVETAIDAALQDPRVEYAEPDRLLEPAETVPNDERFADMWSLYNNGAGGKVGADIAATRAWDLTTGSDDVVVAITDTGVDIGHQDLTANIWTNPNEIAGNGLDDDNNGLIDDVNGWNFKDDTNAVFDLNGNDYHGTFVSGIVGAVGNNGIGITGVAWHVKLMPLKFISGGSGTTSGAIKAINYAVAQKRKGVNVRVINASWGPSAIECSNSFSQSLKDAITAAGNREILFVCSAGNGICGASRSLGDDLDVAPEYPAAWGGELTNVLSVAAIDRNDGVPEWSNFGRTSVGVAAPGVQVLSTAPRTFAGSTGFYTMDEGTSFAAPYVTGIAALLAAREPSLTAAQIKQRIIATAEPILPLASKVTSAGRANAYNALANRTAALPALGITKVVVTKKFIDIDGLGFVQGAMDVEVNGTTVASARYDSAYALGNGSFTHVFAKLPKADIKALFPVGTAVRVTVINRNTGERSNALSVTKQ